MRLPLFAAVQVQALLASSEASSSSSASLSIQGPSTLLSCTPATYTWTATSGPYTLSIQDHSSTASSVDAAETISEDLVIVSSGESATWIVDVRPGVNVSVSIVDGQGNKAQSEVVFVSEGSLECLD
ncbi:hypothetical protein I317_05869 [Kwoniella heveanensis CBS 569]|nr:hypothetical protein I317_05869 [Kwoniella heveanensis CBS 569]